MRQVTIVEIEISKENSKDEKKKEINYALEDMINDFSRIYKHGMEVLEKSDITDEEKESIITVMANAKGSKKVIGEILEKRGGISKKDKKAIETKMGSFLSGFNNKETEDITDDNDDEE